MDFADLLNQILGLFAVEVIRSFIPFLRTCETSDNHHSTSEALDVEPLMKQKLVPEQLKITINIDVPLQHAHPHFPFLLAPDWETSWFNI